MVSTKVPNSVRLKVSLCDIQEGNKQGMLLIGNDERVRKKRRDGAAKMQNKNKDLLLCCSVYILQQDEIRGESLTTPFSSSTTNVEMDAATAAGMETPTKTRAQAGGELPSLTTFLLDFWPFFLAGKPTCFYLLPFGSGWVSWVTYEDIRALFRS
uniref:Uncharacterized protein n=1 Tax=Ditylenchus dipsaci TaxID=166011 RepID=A0A915E1S3_9BILA